MEESTCGVIHLNDILELAAHLSGRWRVDCAGTRELLGVVKTFCIVIKAVVTWLYIYADQNSSNYTLNTGALYCT